MLTSTTRRDFRLISRAQGAGLGGPLLLVYAALFAVPIVVMAALSFREYHSFTATMGGLTLRNYERIFETGAARVAVIRTLRVSITSVAVCLILGPIVAYRAWRARGRVRSLILLITLAPLFISVVARSFGWAVILGGQSFLPGLFSKSTGLLYTDTAIVIGMVNVFLPFMVLSIYSALQSINPQIMQAAEILGAGRARILANIVLPMTRSGLLAGSIIVFGLSMASFITPALLGGGQNQVVTTLIYQQSNILLNPSTSAALAVVLVLLAAATLVVPALGIPLGRALRRALRPSGLSNLPAARQRAAREDG